MPFDAAYREVEPSRDEIDQSKGLIVLEFGAGWCGHCQALAPALEALLGQRSDVQHIRIADARGKRLGRSFRVKLWPTLIFLRDGQPIAELVRPDQQELKNAFARLSD
jgi:thioredoxin 1